MSNLSILNRVPLEVVSAVAEQVQIQHHPSVASFALASKRCRSAAATSLFRKVTITIDHHDFADAVTRQRDRLHRNSAFEHVRNLDIKCSEDIRIAEDNPEWRSIVGLIGCLPGLTNLSFMGQGEPFEIQQTPFPWTIFYALRGKHPHCSLHLHADPSWLSTLYQPLPDRYKLDLITSPCLRSLFLIYQATGGFDSRGLPVWLKDEVKYILAVAPNLEDLRIRCHAATWTPALADALNSTRPKWPGFSNLVSDVADHSTRSARESVNRRAPLVNFQLTDLEPLGLGSITDWLTRIDCSILENLWLEVFVPDPIPAEEFTFPRLKNLGVSLCSPGRIQHHPDVVRRSCLALEDVFCSSNSLNALEIDSDLHYISWPRTLLQVGRTLRTLHAGSREDSAIGEHIAEQLREHCPVLENLILAFKRTQGDRREVRILRNLGALPRLTTLWILLDASNKNVLSAPIEGFDEAVAPHVLAGNDPSFDDFDQHRFPKSFSSDRWPRNGHIRQALVNSALDEDLACAIFDCISAAKPSGSRLLEFLRVCTYGGSCLRRGDIDDAEYRKVFTELSKGWNVERNLRHDRRLEIRVTEDLKLREMVRADRAQDDDGPQALPTEMIPVFRRIWPSKGGDEAAGWQNDWFSLPLELS